MLVLFCMRGCGRIGRPAFPAPSIVKSGETVFAKPRAHRAARSRRHIRICRHCEERLVRRSSTSEGGSDEAIHSSSFRDGPKDQTSDAQLRIGESRDSGLDASHRPGMTESGLLRGACHRARFAPTCWSAMTASTPRVSLLVTSQNNIDRPGKAFVLV